MLSINTETQKQNHISKRSKQSSIIESVCTWVAKLSMYKVQSRRSV